MERIKYTTEGYHQAKAYLIQEDKWEAVVKFLAKFNILETNYYLGGHAVIRLANSVILQKDLERLEQTEKELIAKALEVWRKCLRAAKYDLCDKIRSKYKLARFSETIASYEDQYPNENE